MIVTNLFINNAGRLRSGWRLSVFVCLFITLTILLGSFTKSILSSFLDLNEGLSNTALAFVLQSFLLILPVLAASLFCLRFLEKLPFASLGLNFHRGWWKDFLYGLGFGAGALLLAALIAAVCGGLQFATNQNTDLNNLWQTLLTSGIVFAFGALGEELLFRGYPLQTFARARMAWAAILLTSLFFSIVHLGNPNVAPYFTFINTILAGIWFALAYLKTRSLWLPFALHLGWNWTMAAILGIPVSGITSITPHPVWLATDLGPVWLTGGNYGLEGGAACTLAVLISIALIYFVPFLKPTNEMLSMTDHENTDEFVLNERSSWPPHLTN